MSGNHNANQATSFIFAPVLSNQKPSGEGIRPLPFGTKPPDAPQPSTFTTLAFPLPPAPTRGADGKLDGNLQQLGDEVFGGLLLFYSYQDIKLPAEPLNPFSARSPAIKTCPQITVTICNRRYFSLSARDIRVSMACFMHMPMTYSTQGPLVWHQCPTLNSSTNIFQLAIKESMRGPLELQLFIKTPSTIPKNLPTTRSLELSFIGKTIKMISPHDTVFLLYKRKNITSRDAGSVGVLRGSQDALSKLAPYFENCKFPK
jgi:hypothetical protein